MLNVERTKLIMKLLTEKKNVQLRDMVEILKMSEATVRRDLNMLERTGKVKRVHGGAVLVDQLEEDVIIKKDICSAEKRIIGKKAASFVRDGDKIFLDAGTTTMAVIEYLKDKSNLKIITNGLSLVDELVRSGIESYLTGGKIKANTGAVVGSTTVSYLKAYIFDVAFIGANGITNEGYFTPDPEEGMVKKAAIERANKVFFLCDTSKIGKTSFVNFATKSEGKLITEEDK